MDHPPAVCVLDLACGSGEATLAVLNWLRTRRVLDTTAIRNQEAPTGRVLDTSAISQDEPTGRTLDTSSISQEEARCVGKRVKSPRILPVDFQLDLDASDPFTQEAYATQTGRQADSYSFHDVSQGHLMDGYEGDGKRYDVCVCSFAAHLIEPSRMYATLSQLAIACGYLLILSPHKKPHIEESHGWTLVHHAMADMRVHVRLYQSLL
jgi:hypothetical protein